MPKKLQHFVIPGETIKLSWDTIEEIKIARRQAAMLFPVESYHPATIALVELAHLVGLPEELPDRPVSKIPFSKRID